MSSPITNLMGCWETNAGRNKNMSFIKINSKTHNPYGRENIYVTGHKADFELISKISAEIQEIQKTSTIYLDADIMSHISIPDEETLFTLSKMNLIVFVITRNFFQKDCFAGTFEFKYAMENNIPILPIMTESKLEEHFDKCFGNLHLLFRNKSNYFEKLKDFIDNKFNHYYFIDDPLPINECVSSGIFISYRKMDRAVADNAIGLLRSYVFLRDVKIWYDDFLHEGEDYNEDIEKQLIESDIFILVVTPNLLQEGNYVIEKEYPLALEKGKYILALLAEDTDLDEFAEKYSGVTKLVDISNISAVAAALCNALQINGKPAEKYPYSADKLYALGRAYIDGDVMERNFRLGISMLEDAAEADSMEACARLAKIWSEGREIPKDYRNAIAYYAKECSLFRNYMDKIFEKFDLLSKSEIDSFKLRMKTQIGILYDYNEACVILGEKERAKATLLLCAQYQEWYQNNQPPMLSAKVTLGSIYLRLGAVYAEEGIYDEALKYYQKSEKCLLREQELFGGSPKYEENIFKLYLELGNFYYNLFASNNSVEFLKASAHYYVQSLKKGVSHYSLYKNENCAEAVRQNTNNLIILANTLGKYGDIENETEIYINIHNEFIAFCGASDCVSDSYYLAFAKFILAQLLKSDNSSELLLQAKNIMQVLVSVYPQNEMYAQLFSEIAIAINRFNQ